MYVDYITYVTFRSDAYNFFVTVIVVTHYVCIA